MEIELQKIENLRNRLVLTALTKQSFLDSEVIELSQRLDRLLNDYEDTLNNTIDNQALRLFAEAM